MDNVMAVIKVSLSDHASHRELVFFTAERNESFHSLNKPVISQGIKSLIKAPASCALFTISSPRFRIS